MKLLTSTGKLALELALRLLVVAVVTIGWVVLIVALAGCPMQRAESPECSETNLAKIEAAYIAEAVEACGDENYDDCEALPSIRKKYQAKRDAWEKCGE